MKITVTSLGCSKNLVDTEVMLGLLARVGATLVEDPGQADCILINTCAFLTEAVQEALDSIVELARYKTAGRASRLVVTGCLVSRYGAELRREVPEIDALVGPSSLEEVVEAVTGRKGPPAVPGEQFPGRLISGPGHRAYLKIGEGCSNHCTYCLIPGLRGEFQSRSLDSVCAEARWLVEQGVREVDLVAQDTGRFGKDTGEGSLADLLLGILDHPADFWIRLLYVHPSRLDDHLLEVMASDDRVCRYIDVPFQHVSSPVLDRMGRRDVARAVDVLERVRRLLPGVYVRTTLMTGFPGETEGDFQELLTFVRGAQINHLGVFSYSREEGTPAASLDGQVDRGVAEKRAATLMAAQEKVSRGLLAGMVGTSLEVVVEGQDEEGPYGRHRGQAPEVDGVVRLDRQAEPGQFVQVRITGSGVHDLEGEVIKDKG
jgi:ribosomal protein S12 methylthiotransferase